MSLDRFKNIDQVEGRTPVYGDTLDPKPHTVNVNLTSDDIDGNFNGASLTPNMEYHVYSEDNLITSRVGLPIPSVTNGNSIGTLNEIIALKPEKDLRDVGINQGAYSIVYNFLHKFNQATVTAISADRTEVVITPIGSVTDLAPSDGAPEGVQVVQTQGGPVSVLPGNDVPSDSEVFNFNDLRNYYNANSSYIPDVVLNFGENNLRDVANIEFGGTRIGIETAQRDYPTDVFNGIPTIYVPVDGRIESEPIGTWVPFIEVYNPAVNQNQLRFGVPTGRSRRFKLKRAADVPQNAGFVNRLIWEPGVNIFTNFDYPDDLNYHPQPNTRHKLQELYLNYQWYNETIEVFDRLIVKLTEPLPNDIGTGRVLSICNRIKRSWVEKIIAFPSNIDANRPDFSEPDFNMDMSDLKSANGTEFETYNSLLDVDATTSQQLVDKYFSGSFGDIKLNIDYSDFTNFVHFSSATERIDNFKFKLEQIEKFNARIDLLQSVSGSEAITNISQSIVRRDRIIGGFDDFEHYLYYDDSSNNYTHWSSSANIIEPYPKESTFPHVLRSTTSTEGSDWYTGTYSSASLYDSFNDARLRNMIPIHLQEDERNGEYITFVDMIGQHFDIQWSYIDSLVKVNSREEHPEDGMSGELLKSVADSLGWKLSNGYSDTNLWNYALGVENDGTLLQSGSLKSKPREEIVQETWRRIVNTIPMLYKTKGTARSIKAILSTYGIPQAFLQIREWGGPTVSTRKNVFERERFVNKLEVTNNDYISNPWDDINGGLPVTVEVIEKLPKEDHNILFLKSNSVNADYNLIWDYDSSNSRGRLLLKKNDSTTVANTDYVPYLNRKDAVIIMNSQSNAPEIGISFVDDFGEILAYETAEVGASDVPQFAGAWANGTNLYVGSGSTTSTASFQELRYYSTRLTEEIIKEHAKNREAYFSDDNTTDLDIDTSYQRVLYRIQPDSGFNTNTTTISSVHPNQQITQSDSGIILSASLFNMDTTNLIGEVDTQFITIPSVGALNLMNNKVRVESASLQGQLDPDESRELSQFDYAPNDSNLLGTYFSTTDTVNYDIYNSEGYFEADDWVGDTDKRYNEDYPLLKYRARNYFQKYTSGTAIDVIMDMLARYDMSVFDQIKQLLPARVDWHKGILIEPHVFERNKYRRERGISISRHHYNGTIRPYDGVISGSRHDYSSSIDLYDYLPSSYSNNTVVRSGETYITQRQQGYWQYSPTGSTVLKARKSTIYQVPKYFYSSEYSASVNLPSSTSMEYAEVQDNRLPLSMENLYYNGCRITSDSLTTDSPDTPDGGPVVEITTVDPNVLVFNGSSENDEAISLSAVNDTQVRTIPSSVLVATQKPKAKLKSRNRGKDITSQAKLFRPTNFILRGTKPKLRLKSNRNRQISNLIDRIRRRFGR